MCLDHCSCHTYIPRIPREGLAGLLPPAMELYMYILCRLLRSYLIVDVIPKEGFAGFLFSQAFLMFRYDNNKDFKDCFQSRT